MNRTSDACDASQASWRTVAIVMGLSMALSAGIHSFVVDVHLREWWLGGSFFVVAAVAQAACAYMVLVSRDGRAAGWGVIVSVALVGAWALSRTAGIPFGPARGVREPVGGLDVIATAAEIVAIGAFIALRARGRSVALVSGTSRVLAVGAVGLTFGLGAATAATMPAHGHAHDAVSSSGGEPFVAPEPPTGPAAVTEAPTESEHPHDASEHGGSGRD